MTVRARWRRMRVAVTAPIGMVSVANNPKGKKKGIWQAIGEIEKDWLRLAKYQLKVV